MTWLNAGRFYPNQPFKEYLQDWHYHAPPRHHAFIEKVATLFEIKLRE